RATQRGRSQYVPGCGHCATQRWPLQYCPAGHRDTQLGGVPVVPGGQTATGCGLPPAQVGATPEMSADVAASGLGAGPPKFSVARLTSWQGAGGKSPCGQFVVNTRDVLPPDGCVALTYRQ